MSGRERGQNREYFGPWLIRQINNNNFEGVFWLNAERTLFRLPWKHFNIRKVDERDYGIFKAWAIQSRRYDPKCEDLSTYKTTFRCALKSICYKDKKMFSVHKDESKDPCNPHKIFRFHGVHEDCPTVPLPSSNLPSDIEEVNLHNEIEHDEDYRLRTSPDTSCVIPFPSLQEAAVIAELLKEIDLDSEEYGTSSTLDLSQDDHAHDIPNVDHVFKDTTLEAHFTLEEFCLNGHEQLLAVEPNHHDTLFHGLGSQYPGYDIYTNGYDAIVPQAEPNYVYPEPQPQICSDIVTVSETQVCNHGLQQNIQQMAINDVHANHTDMGVYTTPSPMGHVPPSFKENGSAQEIPVTEDHQESRTPPKLTSWEITISYRGKEVLKQNVSKTFYIAQMGHIPDAEDVDIVRFPSTDSIVNQMQKDFTDTILNSVGDGLLLEVSPHDYMLYATRMGNARVYWSMSGSLETKANASQSKKLERNIATNIFDFKQFWEELKDYIYHKRSSPDYTIYLSFGHYLFEPVSKPLVLVKLVPSFCTFYHQVAQKDGASSLNTEQISLQISCGNSFNILDGPCFMDIDISNLSCLF